MDVPKFLTKTEIEFNIAGSIPVVGIFSGIIRTLAAKIQFIAGAIIGVAGLIGQMIQANSKKWEDLGQTGLNHVIHGSLNFLRGTGEMLLGFTLIGSLALLIAQSTSPNKFNPIVKYEEPVIYTQAT